MAGESAVVKSQRVRAPVRRQSDKRPKLPSINGRESTIASTRRSPGSAVRWTTITYTWRPYTAISVRSMKVSNVHAGSEVHKPPRCRERGRSPQRHVASRSSPIGCALLTLDPTTRARMGQIFDVCFMMAKESIVFAKYPSLLELEKRHGVDLGHAYTTTDSAL